MPNHDGVRWWDGSTVRGVSSLCLAFANVPPAASAPAQASLLILTLAKQHPRCGLEIRAALSRRQLLLSCFLHSGYT
jgi:hypothetical protein